MFAVPGLVSLLCALLFWLLGTATVIFLRPRDERLASPRLNRSSSSFSGNDLSSADVQQRTIGERSVQHSEDVRDGLAREPAVEPLPPQLISRRPCGRGSSRSPRPPLPMTRTLVEPTFFAVNSWI